jgi:Fe-S cluster assembly scaffold protein SufB
LHQALVSSGTFLFVPRGVEIEQPIEIFHWLRHDNMSIFPHLLLVTDELAKVTVSNISARVIGLRPASPVASTISSPALGRR